MWLPVKQVETADIFGFYTEMLEGSAKDSSGGLAYYPSAGFDGGVIKHCNTRLKDEGCKAKGDQHLCVGLLLYTMNQIIITLIRLPALSDKGHSSFRTSSPDP